MLPIFNDYSSTFDFDDTISYHDIIINVSRNLHSEKALDMYINTVLSTRISRYANYATRTPDKIDRVV